VEKKTPQQWPLRGARSFFHNEFDPRKIRRLLDVVGPKISSLSVLLKMNIKFTALTDPPISQ
jgi:hypothetical protein